MPYRAMLFSIFTVLVALLAVGVWVRSIAPYVASADENAASEQTHPDPSHTLATQSATNPSTIPENSVDRAVHLHRHVQGIMLLSFVLICLLLIVGFAATFREWVRFTTRKRPRQKRERTPYVDAWKLAGEKAQTPNPTDLDDDDNDDEDDDDDPDNSDDPTPNPFQ